MKNFVAGFILCISLALIGAIVLIHDMEKPLRVKVRPAPHSIEALVREKCGGENATVEPAYQCFDKRGRRTKIILEKDLK